MKKLTCVVMLVLTILAGCKDRQEQQRDEDLAKIESVIREFAQLEGASDEDLQKNLAAAKEEYEQTPVSARPLFLSLCEASVKCQRLRKKVDDMKMDVKRAEQAVEVAQLNVERTKKTVEMAKIDADQAEKEWRAAEREWKVALRNGRTSND